jgi:uncharacterized membrane protein YkoI
MRPRPTPKRIAVVVASTAVLSVGAIGAAYAIAGDDDGQQHPIPAGQLKQAERAALDETGGGRVTGTEVGDEESLYEVEVTLDDSTQVDVQLDADFVVVGTKADSDQDEPDSE